MGVLRELAYKGEEDRAGEFLISFSPLFLASPFLSIVALLSIFAAAARSSSHSPSTLRCSSTLRAGPHLARIGDALSALLAASIDSRCGHLDFSRRPLLAESALLPRFDDALGRGCAPCDALTARWQVFLRILDQF